MGVTTSTANAGATYVPIASQTLGSAASSVTFSSIAGTYTDLIVVINAKAVTGTPSIALRFNSDSGSNYSYTGLAGNGSSASSARASNTSTAWVSAYLNGVSSTNWNNGIIHIMNYANSTTYKTSLARWAGADYEVDAIVTLWRSTSAITEVNLIAQSNLVAGSTFTLYGIKAA